MPDAACTLFDTPVGRCAIAWTARGIAGLQLPERDDAATLARLARSLLGVAEAPAPPHVRRAIEAIVALLRGAPCDLAHLDLDWSGVPDFDRRVLEATRRVGPGRTTSYGALARELGEPGAARAIGGALGRNRFALIVPCHRVLAAGGASGGFSARGGATLKRRLLAIEGALDGEALPLFAAGGAA